MTTTTDRRQGVNSSIAIKAPVVVATTANITLEGTQTIDGVAVAADDRVLVKDQTDGTENGIYDVNSSTWTRSPDWDGSYDVVTGTMIKVNSGTVSIGLVYEITTTGTITIGSTSLAFGTVTVFASGQMAFPATQNPSSNANTLDDYEEGTWSPVLSDGTNNATSATAVGRYTKIGRAVHITCRLVTSSLDSVSGNIRITGLPENSSSVTNSHCALAVGQAEGLAITAGYSVSAFTVPGTDYIELHVWDATTGPTNMQESEWTLDGGCILAGTYFV